VRRHGKITGPLPGPLPQPPRPTGEQKAAIAVGALFLVLGLATSVSTVWGAFSGHSTLATYVAPVLYLALGWCGLLYGQLRLNETARTASLARGPLLAVGLLVVLLCAPLAGSFYYGVDAVTVTFDCECGSRVKATGTVNFWGSWLELKVRVIGLNHPTPLHDPRTCPHLPPTQ